MRRILPWVSAAASGAATVLAFAPFRFSLLAVACPAVLFWLWAEARPGRAFALGYVWGLGLFGVGVSWVYVSLHRYGGMPAWVAGPLVLLFIGFLALFPAVVGGLWRRWMRPDARGWLLGLPALWVAVEWVRGVVFTGFPWLDLGYSQTTTPIGALAPIGGVYAVSAVVVWAAAVLVIAWRTPSFGRRLAWLALFVATGPALRALDLVAWTHPVGPEIPVALVQANVPVNLKWVPGRLTALVDRYLNLSEGALDARLVVWPETAIPQLLSRLRPVLLPQIQAFAVSHTAHLLFGVIEDRGTRYYNSVVSVAPDGTLSYYRKRHLVPFGEYMPLPWLFRPFFAALHLPMSSLNAWHGPEMPIAVAHNPLGISVCYEDAFGSEVAGALPAARLLVNVSDDGWFGRSFAREQHLEMGAMRARETGRMMLVDTNSGVTAVLDPHGRVLVRLPSFMVGVLSFSVQPYEGETPYVHYRNLPILVAVVAALLGALVRSRR